MVIMFLLGATSTLGAVSSIYLAVLHVVDDEHRLRSDRLKNKPEGSALWRAMLGLGSRCRSSCCGCCFRSKQKKRKPLLPRSEIGDGHSEAAPSEVGSTITITRAEDRMDGCFDDDVAVQTPERAEQPAAVVVAVEDSAADDLTAPLLQPDGEQASQPAPKSWAGWAVGYVGYYVGYSK